MNPETYIYETFGLCIASNREIPRLRSRKKENRPDVILHIGESVDLTRFKSTFELNFKTAHAAERTRPPDPVNTSVDPWQFCYRIHFWNQVAFVINANGTEIWLHIPDQSSFDFAIACLVGPIMGLVLGLHRRLCLHASVIDIDGYAIALLAPSGGGKSTTAAALTSRGHPLISDDILVLTTVQASYFAEPGYPGVRLFDDSIAHLFNQRETALNFTPSVDKRCLNLQKSGYDFSNQARPLLALYTRGTDQQPSVPTFDPAPPDRAFRTLIAHTYPGHYYPLPASIRSNTLKQLAALSEQLGVREMEYIRSLNKLPELCDALVSDARELIAASKQIPPEIKATV